MTFSLLKDDDSVKEVIAKIDKAISLMVQQPRPTLPTRVYIGYSLKPFEDIFTPKGKGEWFSKLQELLEDRYRNSECKITFGVDGVEGNFRAWVELS